MRASRATLASFLSPCARTLVGRRRRLAPALCSLPPLFSAPPRPPHTATHARPGARVAPAPFRLPPQLDELVGAHEDAATSAANPIARLANTHFRGPIAQLLRAGDPTEPDSSAPASAEAAHARAGGGDSAAAQGAGRPGAAACVPIVELPSAASLAEEEEAAAPLPQVSEEEAPPVAVTPAAAAVEPAPTVTAVRTASTRAAATAAPAAREPPAPTAQPAQSTGPSRSTGGSAGGTAARTTATNALDLPLL